jgi:hypothetical protein
MDSTVLFNNRKQNMNSQTIYQLFLNGAYHEDDKLHHASFRKGYRKITSGNISLVSAERKLRTAGLLQSGIVGEFFRTTAKTSE